MGYANKLSVAPGTAIEFKVSAAPEPYRMTLVRLGGVLTSADVPHGTVERTVVPHPAAGSRRGRRQQITTGSFGHAPFPTGVEVTALLVDLWCRPTRIDAPRQVLLSSPDVGGHDSWALCLEHGVIALEIPTAVGSPGAVRCAIPPTSQQWIRVLAGYEPSTGDMWLSLRGSAPWDEDRIAVDAFVRAAPSAAKLSLGGLTLAAALTSRGPVEHFDGRLEGPKIFDRSPATDPVAAEQTIRALDDLVPTMHWDLAQGMDTDEFIDVSPRELHGAFHQHPARAVTGHLWTGQHHDPRKDPAQWAAVHFHSDDLADAGWSTDFTVDVPTSMPSGIYAARIEQGTDVEEIPFYVTSAPDRRNEVLFLAPTNTYLAYANEHLAHGVRGPAHESMMAGPIRLSATDEFLRDHPELGLSLYDTHADGSGVIYSTRLRPVLNMRADYITWLTAGRRHFAADFFLTGWLEHLGVAFDVATDEDLHGEGTELLDDYRVVITGSHPEYVSANEYDALQEYAAHGGRIMYLGANGFFWVTSPVNEDGAVIECRRGFAAQRNWTSHPGELHHSSTGEIGGAWLHRGRNSRDLFGVGMCAAGWGEASPYARTPVSFDARFKFLFEGVGLAQLGAEGLVLGGAAGDELDSADYSQGTPRHATILLTSRHGSRYLPTLEASQSIAPDASGDTNPEVRADAVIVRTSQGGGIFSAGSICWAGGMAVDGYANHLARLTTRVLVDFMHPTARLTSVSQSPVSEGERSGPPVA